MKSDCPAFRPQLLQERIAVQRGDGIAAVNRWGEGFHQQVQAVGKTVPGDFPLAQFQLMQGGVHRLLRDALDGDLLQHVEHQRFDRFGVFGVGAFQAANEGGLARGGIETAHRRRRGAKFGSFQRVP